MYKCTLLLRLYQKQHDPSTFEKHTNQTNFTICGKGGKSVFAHIVRLG